MICYCGNNVPLRSTNDEHCKEWCYQGEKVCGEDGYARVIHNQGKWAITVHVYIDGISSSEHEYCYIPEQMLLMLFGVHMAKETHRIYALRSIMNGVL